MHSDPRYLVCPRCGRRLTYPMPEPVAGPAGPQGDVYKRQLQFHDLPFDASLLVFGLIVFSILRKVPKLPGDLDLLGNLLTGYGLKILQLFLQLLSALRRQNGAVLHAASSYPCWAGPYGPPGIIVTPPPLDHG